MEGRDGHVIPRDRLLRADAIMCLSAPMFLTTSAG